jgi:hypothetical protein
VITEDVRFEGFDTRAWLNLLSLFGISRTATAHLPAPDGTTSTRRGTLVVVTDVAGTPCAALVTDRGAVAIEHAEEVDSLAALCARFGVERAIVLQEGTIEELTERAADRLEFDGDYAAQWLALLSAARELEDEAKLRFHPPRSRLPLPTAGMLRRALDLLLPDEHALVFVLWDGQEIWTAFALHRHGGEIDRIVGPELLLDWVGPLGGDFRRDQRALRRAVARALGPVHVGVFAQREHVEALLRDPSPGAWARAIALREVIINPAPPYVHMAVGADAARALGRQARSWFGGIDLFSYVTPAAEFAREHVARIGSITSILGFNPLQALATRLRRRARDERAPRS